MLARAFELHERGLRNIIMIIAKKHTNGAAGGVVG
jgi:hypothetical protein